MLRKIVEFFWRRNTIDKTPLRNENSEVSSEPSEDTSTSEKYRDRDATYTSYEEFNQTYKNVFLQQKTSDEFSLGKLKDYFSGPEVMRSEIHNMEKLSKQGAQSTVYKGFVHGIPVCVKEIKTTNQNALSSVFTEARIFSRVNHPNICLFLGACVESDGYLLISELCSTDLGSLMESKKFETMDLSEKLRIALDFASGMEWLHRAGIVHLDLKPENLLLDDSNVVKVADFGYSRLLKENRLHLEGAKLHARHGGTPMYTAPERLTSVVHTRQCDVYSFGIIFWQLLTGEIPFKHHLQHNDFNRFVNCVSKLNERPPLHHVAEKYKSQYSGELIEKLQALIERSWEANHEKRPSFSEIIRILNSSLIQVAVIDPTAQRFWQENFLTQALDDESISSILKIEVSWKDFIKRFCALPELQPLELPDDLEVPTAWSTEILPENPTPEQIKYASDESLQQFENRSQKAMQIAQKEFLRRTIVLKLHCLRYLVCDREKDIVSLHRFGKIVDIFSPLSEKSGDDILTKILEMLNQLYFYGDMSQEEAYQLLKDKELGSFVVRFSEHSSKLVISAVVKESDQKQVKHYRVTVEKGQFRFPKEKKNYSSLDQLLQSHSDVFRKPQGQEAKKFEWLTRPRTSKVINGGYAQQEEELHW